MVNDERLSQKLICFSRIWGPRWPDLARGIRHITEDLCTRQLGYRTEFDAAEAQRATYINIVTRRLIAQSSAMQIELRLPSPLSSRIPGTRAARDSVRTLLIERRASERLMELASMDWRSPPAGRVGACVGFVNALQAMQRSADCQKTLAAHGPNLR